MDGWLAVAGWVGHPIEFIFCSSFTGSTNRHEHENMGFGPVEPSPLRIMFSPIVQVF